MKNSKPRFRASHVNSGTAVPPGELPWPKTRGRVTRLPKVHVEVDEASEVTPYGGLDLVTLFCRRFRVADCLDRHVRVLKRYLPYRESDHLLAQALNLYVGGTCIEDQANLQGSEAVRRLLGACRIPDPTTSGDFLRRFDAVRNPGALPGLRAAVDEVQGDVWKRLRRGRRRRPLAVVDIDVKGKKLYGTKKQGADFSYTGVWSYRALVFTLAEVGECLAVRLRPGNTKDPVGVPEVIRELTPRLKEHFVDVLFRADNAFDESPVRKACEDAGAYFAFVGRGGKHRSTAADAIPVGRWSAFTPRAQRQRDLAKARPGYRPRRRSRNRRRRRARERGYLELRLRRQALAEVPLVVGNRVVEAGRLVFRRQLIHKFKGQDLLVPLTRYRYVVTNLPAESYSSEAVVDLTYERCDQENVIEQLGSGLAAWRMPVREFDGNAAWLEIARLAWNLGKWIAQLALPEEVVRWEWKRFRQAFVFAAAKVLKRGRRIILRYFGSHRWVGTLLHAHQKLQI